MHSAPRDGDGRTLPAGGKEALLSVSDTGVGVPSGEDRAIFEAFFTTKPQGTGIGLTLSRCIIESHGGRLWAEPRAQGATFRFTLPARPEA